MAEESKGLDPTRDPDLDMRKCMICRERPVDEDSIFCSHCVPRPSARTLLATTPMDWVPEPPVPPDEPQDPNRVWPTIEL